MLLLASNSPRRRQLISLGGWMFTVMVSNVDESQRVSESPAEYVLRLAEAKARAVAEQAHPEHIVIGSDTSVVDGSDILGKPADVVEAEQMLKRLRGHTHQVYTGIAALRVRDGKLVTDLCVTDVPMRNYSDEEIEAYIQTGDPLDKAGAYAIQHPRFQPVEKLSGCFASVMGLPLCHLVRTLRQLDLPPAADVPTNCQTHLDYQCPVSRAILRGENVG
ncbi:MAG: septum formation protein Maf [Chloroflexi bacterium]|nr:septum formation protein Maf [Chloroflexota bacterium]